MATLWRNVPPGLPFLWEQDNLAPARWHGTGDGPVQYLADTPDGSWAELLRHEEIVEPGDVAGLSRDLWAIEVPEAVVAGAAVVEGDDATLRGGPGSYPACRRLAAAARAGGADAIVAPSAALEVGAAAGWRVDGGLVREPPRDAQVVVLFGLRPGLVGQRAVASGHPPPWLVGSVRPLYARRARRSRLARPVPGT